jgi:MFS transporter, DHA1 family, tetracycline resistance protein
MAVRSPLLPIFMTVFVDVLGLTLVLPLLPYYALHFQATPLLVGCISATYAVCQLVSGPILGRVSDRVGRKPTLLASQAGSFFGFLVMGAAQYVADATGAVQLGLAMLFVSRAIDGSTAGNLSIAQAYISDATKPEERTRAFGFIGIAFGAGFTIGPAISGFLAHHFSYAAPAFMAAALSATSIVLTATLLPHHRPAERHADTPATGEAASTAPAGRRTLDFRRFFRRPEARRRLLEFFAFTTAFSTLIGGLGLYLHARFKFDVDDTGYVYTLAGVVGGIVQGGLIGRLARTLGESKLALFGFACMAAGYLFLGAAYHVPTLVVLVTLAAIGQAVTRPALTTLLTKSVGPHEQGEVLGTSQSLASISQIVGPVAAGWFIGRGQLYAYGFMAGGCALIGAALTWWQRDRTVAAPHTSHEPDRA